MVNGESPIIEFQGHLEDCVLLVKHPLNDTIHPWWAYGKFVNIMTSTKGVPLFNEDGEEGYTHSLLEFVTNRFENHLWYEGECLLMGVAHLDSFDETPPIELFRSIHVASKEDLI